MSDGMPHSAYYVSNRNDMRETELARVWNAATPDKVVLYSRHEAYDSAWVESYIQSRGDIEINRYLAQ